jgi:hypothetical protein
MDKEPIIRPQFEPEVLEAKRKRGDALDLGRYRLTPPAQQPEPIKQKHGLAKVFGAIVSAIAAGAVIYAVGQNLDKADSEPQDVYSGRLSVPIDMTPAPQRREPLIP